MDRERTARSRFTTSREPVIVVPRRVEHYAGPIIILACAALAALFVVRWPEPSPTADAVAWNIIRDTTDRQSLQRFVESWPASPFADQARARIRTLAAVPAITPPANAYRMPALQKTTPQNVGSPNATRGSYIGGWRPDGKIEPRRTTVRTLPIPIGVGSDALSPQPLAKSGGQLGGGVSYGPGYLPEPRKVPATVIPAHSSTR